MAVWAGAGCPDARSARRSRRRWPRRGDAGALRPWAGAPWPRVRTTPPWSAAPRL